MALVFDVNWRNGFSWRTRKYRNTLLYPEVRIQAGFDECAHCSLCPSVEVRNQKRWVDSQEYDVKKHYRVDLDRLKKDNPPPLSPSVIIENITENYQGFIRATGPNNHWPFQVTGCKIYNTFPNDPDAEASFFAVANHINNEGPVVGCFRVGTNYDRMGVDEVYFSGGKYVPFDLKEPDIPLVHGVCLTGLVEVKSGTFKHYAYEAIECGKLIPNNRRLRYILACEIDYVYVPIC